MRDLFKGTVIFEASSDIQASCWPRHNCFPARKQWLQPVSAGINLSVMISSTCWNKFLIFSSVPITKFHFLVRGIFLRFWMAFPSLPSTLLLSLQTSSSLKMVVPTAKPVAVIPFPCPEKEQWHHGKMQVLPPVSFRPGSDGNYTRSYCC